MLAKISFEENSVNLRVSSGNVPKYNIQQNKFETNNLNNNLNNLNNNLNNNSNNLNNNHPLNHLNNSLKTSEEIYIQEMNEIVSK
jgi:hypothetical protein